MILGSGSEVIRIASVLVAFSAMIVTLDNPSAIEPVDSIVLGIQQLYSTTPVF